MTTEAKRFQIQQGLDAGKSQQQRNVLGQFSTPYKLAREIVEWAVSRLSATSLTMLEPACGTGVFFSALKDVSGEEALAGSVGFEVDAYYQEPAYNLWNEFGVDVRHADFLTQKPDRSFPLLVANPPYSRHHHIPNETKIRLKRAVEEQTGLTPSGLSGLYSYFMLLSSQWLSEGALSCWLVPSEFMDVNYGEVLKRFLLEQVDLLRIHRFDERDVQFSDALVTSSVVFFRKCQPSANPVEFTYGGSVLAPGQKRLVARTQLKAGSKWNGLFCSKRRVNTTFTRTLGDYFSVKRGIATGCNDFFVINLSTISQYGIPQEYLTPILPSPRKMKADLIESVGGRPKLEDPLFLFSTKEHIDVIARKYPGVAKYIKKGESKKVNESYICSRHDPWYSCEERASAPFVIPYMGRNDGGNRLFRFILNESDAIATNGYLMMYPKKEYSYLFKNRRFAHLVWEQLNAIPTEDFEQQGRFYGGGLHKMEPRELMNLPVEGISQLMGGDIQFKVQSSSFKV